MNATRFAFSWKPHVNELYVLGYCLQLVVNQSCTYVFTIIGLSGSIVKQSEF